ncbi:MAG: endolytic transglycosylase MltG [Acetobacter sp.]|nr:endolytic transglycosylase MltG [Bacteroides sp.]MCM1340510.1 endolytic transglycosylase MltG [Acetobacter sp.]MCM1433250.1 endolytic transglycosylase MltG [Clostridiales bacterium]
MNNDEFKLEEAGINPVATANEKNDFYFSNVDTPDEKISSQRTQSAVKKAPHKKPKSKGVASTYLFFLVVIVLSMILSIYAVLCMNDVLAITKTTSNVTVNLSEQLNDMNEAVDILADNGLIKCKNFCKLFAKFRESQVGPQWRNGVYFEDKGYEAGVYYLNAKMGLEGMLQTLQGNATTAETVTLTFPEGYTVPEIVDKLVANEVCDKAALLAVIETTDFSYSLVNSLEAKEEVPYRLEGYLFPDTYDFYVGESASSALKKFLSNGDSKVTEKYRNRAKELGYSMHEIMTIASIIQMEAGSDAQMKEISSVIHNRISDKANFPYLGCESTTDYIKNKVAPSLASTSAHTSEYYLNYYNTNQMAVGLPAGPICNPGVAAINAALYPDDTDYYYFFHDIKGNLYTAKSFSEFNEKIQAYAPYLNAN